YAESRLRDHEGRRAATIWVEFQFPRAFSLPEILHAVKRGKGEPRDAAEYKETRLGRDALLQARANRLAGALPKSSGCTASEPLRACPPCEKPLSTCPGLHGSLRGLEHDRPRRSRARAAVVGTFWRCRVRPPGVEATIA